MPQLVQRKVDAVIGDTALRVVISTYALGTITRTHQALALSRFFIVLLLLLFVFQPFGQNLKGLVLVAMLSPLILAFHHQTSGQVRLTHGCVSFIDVLSASTPCPERTNAQC